MFSRISTVAFTAMALSSTFLSPQCAGAQEVQTLSVFELNGAANLPASVLAIIGKEGGGYTGVPLHQSSYTDQSNIDRMLKSMEVANARYSEEKQGVKVLQQRHDSLQLKLRLADIALDTRTTSAILEITSKAISERVNSVVEESTAYYSNQYDMSIKNVVDLAVTRASNDAVQKWDGKVTNKNAGQAMSEIFGDGVDFFNRFALADMSPEAKQEIINAKADMLASALSRVKAMSDVERAADRAQLEGKITSQAAQIKKIANDVTVFRKQWKEELTALQVTQEATAASLKAELIDVKGDVNTIQMQMWRGMGLREQLAALKDGFLRSMDPTERVDTIQKLSASVQIMDRRDEALKVLGYAGQIGDIIAQVGLPIDIQNFQKNVQTTTVAVNVITNLALGGSWLSAAQGAITLFGGGGGDAGAERHTQIMRALGEIMRTQQETLKKLDDISRQIAISTNRIQTSLAKMDQKLDLIVVMDRHATLKDATACSEFIRRAETDNMNGGLFPTYSARRNNFNQDIESGYAHYATCRKFINHYKNVNEQDVFNDGKIIPLIFREDMISNVKTERIGPLLNRMLQVTSEYGQVSGSGQCMNRMLAYLSDAPRTFASANMEEFICKTDPERSGTPIIANNPDRKLTSQNDRTKLTSQNDRTIEGYEALSDAVSAGAVKTIANYVLFFAPYNALLSSPTRLATLDELAARKDRPKSDNDDAVLWPKHYQDLISISLAQQAVLSGVYALPLAEDVLIDNEFGHHALEPWMAKDKVANHKCALPENATPPEKATYQTVMCLLGENPWFLSNLTRHMVTKTLSASGATLSNYEFALRSNDGTNISKLLGDIPVKWKKPEGDIRSPWVIDLLDAGGNSWEVPLPTTVEIRSNTVAYRPVAEELFKLRKAFQDRIVLQDDSVQDLANESAGGFLLRRAVMSSPSLVTVNLN
jgi:hypothetical protein